MIRDLFSKKRGAPEEIYSEKGEEDPYLQASHHDDSNWLVSYADMMTLLCGFFIMLFSLANIDAVQYQRVQESLSKQFGGKMEKPHGEEARFLTKIIQEKGLEDKVMVRTEAEGVNLVLQTQQFFGSLSAEMTPEGISLLEPLLDSIKELQIKENRSFRLVIEGHSDSRAVLSGPYPSNWELSSARAGRVVRYFVEKGFAPNTLSAAGYADTRPEVNRAPAEMTEVDHAKNRRVVIRVLDDGHPGRPANSAEPSAAH